MSNSIVVAVRGGLDEEETRAEPTAPDIIGVVDVLGIQRLGDTD